VTVNDYPKVVPSTSRFKQATVDKTTGSSGWRGSYDLARYDKASAMDSAENYAYFAMAMYFDEWWWVGREGKAVSKEPKTRGPRT